MKCRLFRNEGYFNKVSRLYEIWHKLIEVHVLRHGFKMFQQTSLLTVSVEFSVE